MTFDRPVAVFADACHPSDGYHPGPVTALDGLVAALSEQKGWAEVTTPADITVDGYAGKAFQRTAPADMSDCDTRTLNARKSQGPYPDFRSWQTPDGGTDGGFYYEAGQIETVRVLDLDGTVVVFTTELWPEPSAAAHAADFAAVLGSIRIARGADVDGIPVFDMIGAVPPRALSNTQDRDRLAPGTYFVDEVSGTPTPQIFITIGAGWSEQDDDNALWIYNIGPSGGLGDGDGFMLFGRPAAVFSDACHSSEGYSLGRMSTLDGLVAALSEQEGSVDVTAPRDIFVDGYAGKRSNAPPPPTCRTASS